MLRQLAKAGEFDPLIESFDRSSGRRRRPFQPGAQSGRMELPVPTEAAATAAEASARAVVSTVAHVDIEQFGALQSWCVSIMIVSHIFHRLDV